MTNPLAGVVQPGKHEPGRAKCARARCPRTAAIRRMVRGPDGRLYGSGCARILGYIVPRPPRRGTLTRLGGRIIPGTLFDQSAREQPAMSQLTTARRFVVQRNADPSGVSGTGIMLDGIVWPDGTVSTHWRDPNGEGAWSNVFWPNLAAAESKHCYGGHSSIVWVDDEPAPPAPAVAELAEPAAAAAVPSPDAQ